MTKKIINDNDMEIKCLEFLIACFFFSLKINTLFLLTSCWLQNARGAPFELQSTSYVLTVSIKIRYKKISSFEFRENTCNVQMILFII